MSDARFKHVQYLWKDQEVAKMSPSERLVYRSNRLGDDLTLTNTGGGNTSAKVVEKDPMTGKDVEVLWIKGSGGDLRTAKKDGFASLYLDKVRALTPLYQNNPGKGPKTAVEDGMVEMFNHCVFNLNPRACSIDTPLHTLVPKKHVDHLHPNAVIALAASVRQEMLTKEIYGQDVFWVPWQRPGFDMSSIIEDQIRKSPSAKGVVLGHHGMSAWHDDDKICYETTLWVINRAAEAIAQRDKGEKTFGGAKVKDLPEGRRHELLADLLPWLRGKISGQRRFVGTVQHDARMLRFVNSADAKRLAGLGTSCPDHFLRTKIKPLFIDWNPEKGDVGELRTKLDEGLAQYREDYAAYYKRCKKADSPAMRDPNPTVVLVPGLGMMAWGKSKSESRVTAEFYNCAVEVMRGAEALDQYEGLPEQEAFDIEYWSLEEAKLRRMPPEKELDRQIIAVVGAGSGIGKELAHRLVKDGAHVVCVDRDENAAKATAAEIVKKLGEGIGVAGTGISNCGPAIGIGCDITKRETVAAMLQQTLLAYGGLDGLAVTAGTFMAPGRDGRNEDAHWAITFAVNVTGSYIVADEAQKIFARQGLRSSIVLTTSVNAVVAKKGSFPYDTSKAAANHLVREMAIECAPLTRVNGVAPATVVKGSSMFPRERVIPSLTKYNIPFQETETDEQLRDKLAGFYAKRTLLQTPIEPADQAEAMYLFFTQRYSKTTGQVIHVDGGLADGMLR
jgi:rhamnulose-1-phosphate aldolase/alcohol dehydrogenase